ncbi:endothelial lipase-like [Chrysoperla carnea]|uniref:endothelial lipase-like n=1 Tax=Chrysoperla carnea TaxID=189513 RepID=UPI001D09605A|nr:endothelial lipase-like [Chrysoperla carnea]
MDIRMTASYMKKDLLDCIVPESTCPNSNISFWIYTSNDADNPTRFYINDINHLSTLITSSRLMYFDNTLKILIHGYGQNRNDTNFKMLRTGFFKKSNCSIIMVDYGPLAELPCYQTAVINSELVANCTAKMIDYLVENASIPINSIHVIAHSLGAQVSGKIANYLKSGKIGRISGLDPALPLFETDDLTKILDKEDAQFVDIIHTNALVYGQIKDTGHIDFYVNGGTIQPGCDTSLSVTENTSCNHVRSVVLYAESIDNTIPFVGRKCGSLFLHNLGVCRFLILNPLATMGEYVSRDKTGKYYLSTNKEPPYALGKDGAD